MSGSDLTADPAATAGMSPRGAEVMVGTDPGTTETVVMPGKTMAEMLVARTGTGRVTAIGTSASAKRKRTR